MSQRDDPFPDAPTVARPRFVPPASSALGFVITVVDGVDRGKALEIEVGREPQLVGKGPVCQLLLTDPEVSRRHASLEAAEEGLRVRELGSTNGTFLSDVRIQDAFATAGQLVRVGRTTLHVDRASTAKPAPPQARGFGRLIGESAAMRRIYPLCERLAQSSVPIVVEGETGTGKEQLAEALHERSPRSGAAFVVFDCTAVAQNLIESELFGHEKGAFTGATSARQGVFERADGGTLLIDEIGDLPLELQPKLLRVIERMTLTRVGGDRPIRVDARVIAATRRNLDHEVEAGRFRDDLFHRLAVGRVELPPLRARTGDVALLVRHFCTTMGESPAAIPPEQMASWADDAWPGNVRELRNAVARRFALGDLGIPEPADAGSAETTKHPSGNEPRARASRGGDPIERILALDLPLTEARQRLLDEFETRYIERALENAGGNVTRAAAAAGVTRRYLQRLKAQG